MSANPPILLGPQKPSKLSMLAADHGHLTRARSLFLPADKRTHWMWYIFPQLKELGQSDTAKFYGIEDLAHARAYVRHELLGARLKECVNILLAAPAGATASSIFGYPDDVKLRSCLTLFGRSAPPCDRPPFAAALARYYAGSECPRTVELLSLEEAEEQEQEPQQAAEPDEEEPLEGESRSRCQRWCVAS